MGASPPMSPAPRVRIRFLLAPLAALAALAAGCAAPVPAPRPSSPEVPAPRRPSVPSRSSVDEVRARLEAGDAEGARLALESARASGTIDPADEILLDGDVLAAAGRPDEALVRWYRIEGVPGGRERAAEAWDRIAQVRAASGEPPREVARARLTAWRLADERGRRERADAVARALAGLATPDLRALAFDATLADASGLLASERARRREPTDVAVALLAPTTGRFERYGRAFRLGAEIALRDRDASFPLVDAGDDEDAALDALPPGEEGPAPRDGALPEERPEEEGSEASRILGAEEFLARVRGASEPAPEARDESDAPGAYDTPEGSARSSSPFAPAALPASAGPPVRLVPRDTAGELGAAIAAARDVIVDDGAAAIVGPLLSVTSLGAGAVAEAHGVPLLAPTATDPALADVGLYVMPLAPEPRRFTEPLARVVVEDLGLRRFGALVPRDGTSAAFEESFREAVESRGGEVVLSITFDPDESDFRRQLERLDDARVDAVYVPGASANLERLADQLDFYEFPRRILGHGGWTDPRLLDPANLALEGAILSIEESEDPDSDLVLHLRERVWDATREELGRFHVQGYRAMAALLAAIDGGARDGETIARTLRLRDRWPEPPRAERVRVLAFRDGVLGPASWAGGFTLKPKLPPVPEEETEEPADADPALRGGIPDRGTGDPVRARDDR